MKTQGKVRGFCGYTPQIMEQMKHDLNIGMSLQALLYCATYYRTQEKRDPFIEELKMLDRFVAAQPASATFFAPTELLTNDHFVAETYADMMQKRRILNPNAKHPCTVAEAFTIADAYLERAGKSRTLPSLLSLTEEQKNHPFAAAESNCAVSPSAAFRFRVLPKGTASLEGGDLLVLLLPTSQNRKERYGVSVSDLFNTPAATGLMKRIYTVSESGLLGTLLDIAEGVWIDPSRLASCGEDVPFTMLSDFYAGDCLVRIASKHYEALYKKAQTNGIRAIAFASVANGTKFSFAYGHEVLFTLESDFLRSLFPLRPITARLADEHSTEMAKIARVPIGSTSCSYIQSKVNDKKQDTYSLTHALCASACSAPRSSFFRNALDTLLVPVLSLAAAGCDFTVQRLALGLELPQSYSDPTIAGECLSAILGIYRVQTELAIPSSSSTILTKAELSHPRITAFALANTAPPAPAEFTVAGNRVYCLAPETQENGLPVFASVRKLLELLTSLRRKGVLQSAHIICHESITDGNRSMNTSKLRCRLLDDTIAADGALPLAILIETTEEIAATQIGRVEPQPSIPHPVTPTATIENKSLVWSEAPTVTVIAKKQDAAAQILTATIIKKGAEATLLSDQIADAPKLSRAILTSQTLILCGKITLAKTPQMQFAIDTFVRSGGTVLLLGGATWEAGACAIALPNGISESNLDQICGFKK